jgi:hypothetical protein
MMLGQFKRVGEEKVCAGGGYGVDVIPTIAACACVISTTCMTKFRISPIPRASVIEYN